MKTVIIGTDFVYDSIGNLKPVEINTNMGFSMNRVESDMSLILDYQTITDFISSNEFTKVTYIGENPHIRIFLSQICEGLGIQFADIHVTNTSITIPDIEDSTTDLIIRTAYDTTALLDEQYCKNKTNFLNLIKDTEYGSQFAYVNENSELINNITNIKDNGIHPNFILKAVEPNYDKKIYPKLFRVTTQEELEVVLQNVNSDYFLMEYHLNTNELSNDIVTKIRKISLLYPPTLESIHIGAYTDLSVQSLDFNPQYDSNTFELSEEQRLQYITKDFGNIDRPKLMDNDYVIMADGTLKSGLELQVGDIIKTINIPNSSAREIVEDRVEYNIDYDTFINGVTYNQNKVIFKQRIDSYVKMVTLQFTDNSNWSDTTNSKYLLISNNEVQFKTLENVVVGDIILLVDTSDSENVSIQQKVVASKLDGVEKLSGWLITVEETHLFLTKTDASSENATSYAAIEHNFCYVECGKNQCMDPGGFSMYFCNQWS